MQRANCNVVQPIKFSKFLDETTLQGSHSSDVIIHRGTKKTAPLYFCNNFVEVTASNEVIPTEEVVQSQP